MIDPETRARSPLFRLGSSVASAAAIAERQARRVRLVRAAIAVALALAIGTWGYWYLSDGQHTLVQALYMTVISISTVGFNEVIPIQDDTMRVFTMGLILFGGASVVYFLTAVAAYVVEGDFLYGFWRRRLIPFHSIPFHSIPFHSIPFHSIPFHSIPFHSIPSLSPRRRRRRPRASLRRAHDHVIICGLGRVGSHAFAELFRSRATVVGIDREPSRVEALMNTHGPRILFMVGDAVDEAVQRELGIERARTLVAALADDRDNFLLCVTARTLNPRVRLMVRLVDPAHAEMFDELAADAVVHPPALSGVRLANELLLPELTAFTDRLLEAQPHQRLLAEVPIARASPMIGERVTTVVGDASGGAVVLGVRHAEVAADAAFAFGPSSDHRVQAGDALFVLGDKSALKHVRAVIDGRAAPLPSRREQRPTEILPVIRDAPDDAAAAVEMLEGRRGHVVLAGAGAVGRFAVREILRQEVDVTVIDRLPDHLALLAPHPRLVTVVGDVGQRATLTGADLVAARGFITALQPLRDNLFLAANVHRLNPRARVVARVGNLAEARRLRAVGASVVNPGQIGGVHIAHRTTHPELVDFARGLEASWSHPEQLAVVGIAQLPGGVRKLGELDARARTGCVILGYRARAADPFAYHPPLSTRVRIGGAFLALGEPSHIDALRALVGAGGRISVANSNLSESV